MGHKTTSVFLARIFTHGFQAASMAFAGKSSLFEKTNGQIHAEDMRGKSKP